MRYGVRAVMSATVEETIDRRRDAAEDDDVTVEREMNCENAWSRRAGITVTMVGDRLVGVHPFDGEQRGGYVSG